MLYPPFSHQFNAHTAVNKVLCPTTQDVRSVVQIVFESLHKQHVFQGIGTRKVASSDPMWGTLYIRPAEGHCAERGGTC